jgi:post-segregation antitoxin (ccd killing protein)
MLEVGKRVITFLTVAFISSIFFSVLVFAKETVVPAASQLKDNIIDNKAAEANYSLTPEQIKFKQRFLFLEKAKQFGIDTKGLTDEQIEKKVTEKEREIVLIKAEKFGFDIYATPYEQLKERVTMKENEEMIAKAKMAGIGTEGLTTDQVIEKVNERDKQLLLKDSKELLAKKAEEEKKFILGEAQRLQIDTKGLSYEQIKVKVYEKLMPVLLEKAKALSVDFKGLSYEQLLYKVKAEEIELWEKENKK